MAFTNTGTTNKVSHQPVCYAH